jgi:hypothetical protein
MYEPAQEDLADGGGLRDSVAPPGRRAWRAGGVLDSFCAQAEWAPDESMLTGCEADTAGRLVHEKCGQAVWRLAGVPLQIWLARAVTGSALSPFLTPCTLLTNLHPPGDTHRSGTLLCTPLESGSALLCLEDCNARRKSLGTMAVPMVRGSEQNTLASNSNDVHGMVSLWKPVPDARRQVWHRTIGDHHMHV